MLDNDGGKAAVELIQRFEGAPYFKHVFPIHGQDEAVPALQDERAMAVLVIDQNFSRDISSGRPAQVQMLLDGRRSNTSRITSYNVCYTKLLRRPEAA